MSDRDTVASSPGERLCVGSARLVAARSMAKKMGDVFSLFSAVRHAASSDWRNSRCWVARLLFFPKSREVGANERHGIMTRPSFDVPVPPVATNVVEYVNPMVAAGREAVVIVRADADDTTLSGLAVSISSGFTAGDTLSVGVPLTGTGISASYNPATGVLTLTGAASLADYQAIARSIAATSGA